MGVNPLVSTYGFPYSPKCDTRTFSKKAGLEVAVQDVTYVMIILGFTLLAAGFVIFCDHLIGSDEEAIAEESARGDEEEAEEADTHEVAV